MLTVSAGKRPVYILPLYAAEAILIGTAFAYIYENKHELSEKLKISVLLKISGYVFAGLAISAGITFTVISLVVKQSEKVYSNDQ